MKSILTAAVASAVIMAMGMPPTAMAQHGGYPHGGSPGSYHGGHPGSFQGGYHGGRGGNCQGWSTAGQILTGVLIGSVLQNACLARPACPPVVYATPVYQQQVVQYVPAPVVVVQQLPAVETVWIQNSNGSRTPVQLRRADGGMFVGPRGEYYLGLPTNEQLRQIYGM